MATNGFSLSMKFDPKIDVRVSGGVYPPAEDTRLLISILKVDRKQRVLEIGTGSGIVALHCVKKGCRVIASDINPDAIVCTRANARRNNLSLEVVRSDLFDNIYGKFDVIAFNPPYLPEAGDGTDDIALTGGLLGTEMLEKFLSQAIRHLSTDGRIYSIASSIAIGDFEPTWFKTQGYNTKLVGEVSLFFERLWGLELKPIRVL